MTNGYEKQREDTKTSHGYSMPKAPLRAYRYSVAGGKCTKVVQRKKGGSSTWKCSEPLFNVAWGEGSNNPFSNKIVLMDEVRTINRLHCS
jgi:hypothetical protein